MYEALRKGADVDELHALTHIKPGSSSRCGSWWCWRRRSWASGAAGCRTTCCAAKQDGFADRYLARLLGCGGEIREQRKALGVVEVWEPVPVSGVENAAYYYSTYNGTDKVPVSDRRKIMVLGGGPNRIGQGIEFDYCCVHAALAIREAGLESIMVNCNPETVSTDYDTSDKLYFEP
jgi:carbamoyl-phosphate synthase large subunit